MAKVEKKKRSVVRSIFTGEILLELGIDKFFFHIVYLFILIIAAVWISLKVDTTLTKVERNRKIISELEIYHAEVTSELVELGRLSTVEQHLKDLQSEVAMPQKPAIKIKKK